MSRSAGENGGRAVPRLSWRVGAREQQSRAFRRAIIWLASRLSNRFNRNSGTSKDGFAESSYVTCVLPSRSAMVYTPSWRAKLLPHRSRNRIVQFSSWISSTRWTRLENIMNRATAS
jgi:hypothetical protein